jgi:hypothetical protein
MVKNSTATSRAPGTCMIDGALPAVEDDVGVRQVVHDHDVVLARQFATTRSKNSSSTHIAVGLLGKPRIIIFGFGDQLADRALELGDESPRPASSAPSGCRRRR